MPRFDHSCITPKLQPSAAAGSTLTSRIGCLIVSVRFRAAGHIRTPTAFGWQTSPFGSRGACGICTHLPSLGIVPWNGRSAYSGGALQLLVGKQAGNSQSLDGSRGGTCRRGILLIYQRFIHATRDDEPRASYPGLRSAQPRDAVRSARNGRTLGRRHYSGAGAPRAARPCEGCTGPSAKP